MFFNKAENGSVRTARSRSPKKNRRANEAPRPDASRHPRKKQLSSAPVGEKLKKNFFSMGLTAETSRFRRQLGSSSCCSTAVEPSNSSKSRNGGAEFEKICFVLPVGCFSLPTAFLPFVSLPDMFSFEEALTATDSCKCSYVFEHSLYLPCFFLIREAT